jgi:hypothetical protein
MAEYDMAYWQEYKEQLPEHFTAGDTSRSDRNHCPHDFGKQELSSVPR